MNCVHRLAVGFLTVAICLVGPLAFAKTLLFVPQDNRPVSDSYTVETAEWAGYKVLTPPDYLLSGKYYKGSPEQLWQWVEQNAMSADAMILSTDSLIYGGLVDSRKHELDFSTLVRRADGFERLKSFHPNVPIYAFGTVMRSPRASGGGVEPDYYDVYGPSIFKIAALQDKLDAVGLTTEESSELFVLTTGVPVEYLQDWFNRRDKNMRINQQLIRDAAKGIFKYFSLGHDDTSNYSQSALESRYLKKSGASISPEVYGSFPGADQLGLLMVARAHDDFYGLTPKISVIYPLGGADKTVPSYEDQTVGKTLAEHIKAIGGVMAGREKPDLLLAINTPLGTATGESASFENFPIMLDYTKVFLGQIETAINQRIPVSLADIAYSNGSDNTLVYGLMQDNVLYKLTAYNGWNTASNSIGYALAQGILAPQMSSQGHKNMMTTQLLDNWAYQANIRKLIYRQQEVIRTDNVPYSGTLNEEMESIMKEKVQTYAEKYLGVDPRTVNARFPWSRLFEVEIIVHDTPDVVLERDERLRKQKEEAARLQREKELAELAAQRQVAQQAKS